MRDIARSVVALLAFLPTSLAAWANGPANRILSKPAQADTPIANSVPGRVKVATDLGQAPLDHVLSSVTLHFSRSTTQQAALNALLVNQQNPASPQYHKWLTPDQFRDQFGLSDGDLAQVTNWLAAQGLKVSATSYTKTSVTVSGTVAQIQHAFNVSLHTVRVGGEEHISNVNDPVLPAAIAKVTRGITGLSDFKLKPRIMVRPKYTTTTGGHYIAPGDINTIYDLNPLLASAVNGTGITIAVMGQTAISTADVAAFRSAAGLPANVPNTLYTPANLPVSTGDDLTEAQLDVEWAGAIAPNATINFVATNEGNGVLTALTNSIEDTPSTQLAKILSISYGICEQNLAVSDALTFQQTFEQASLQGQTIIGPGGDYGAADCDDGSAAAADGLAVDFPASSPNVTGVGGTMFAEGSGNYWSTTSSATEPSSALSYIPEAVWNETASSGSLAAGGGGASIYFTKPAWQVGTGVPADSARDVPDLALDAAAAHDGYLICSSGSCTNGFLDSQSNVTYVGGTSVATPIFAGMLALVEQKINTPAGLGNINPQLYGLAASSSAAVFHDITSGNNDTSCLNGSPNCPISTSASNASFGYSAAPGYDLASGWGSVDGNRLATQWLSATPAGVGGGTSGANLSTTTISLASGAASCGINSGSLALTVSVASGVSNVATTPTGTVQLFVDGQVLGSSTPLSTGSASFTLNTTTLSSGAHSIAAAYSGDGTYAGSRGNLGPTISPAASNGVYVPSFIDVALAGSPDFSITPCLPTLQVVAGGSASTPITVTGLNGFSGAVTLTTSFDGTFGGTATFSPAQVTVSASGSGTATLNVNAFKTTATTSSQLHVPSGRSGKGAGYRGFAASGAGGVALASLLMCILPRRRRYVGLLVGVVSIGALATTGCGKGVAPISGNSSGAGVNTTVDTQPGYYILNVTATGTGSNGAQLTHTSYLTLAVNQ